MTAPGIKKRAADFGKMHERFCNWNVSEVVSRPEGERNPVSFIIVDKRTRRAVFVFTVDSLKYDRLYRTKLESEKCFRVVEFNVRQRQLIKFMNSVPNLCDLERVLNNLIPILKKIEFPKVLNDCQIN